jgi:hypothetical protein
MRMFAIIGASRFKPRRRHEPALRCGSGELVAEVNEVEADPHDLTLLNTAKFLTSELTSGLKLTPRISERASRKLA